MGKKSENDFWIFVCSANEDLEDFRVEEINQYLKNDQIISKVIYPKDEINTNNLDLLVKYIELSNIIILVCSKNLKNLKSIQSIWITALIKNKIIIPIFKDTGDIPALLTTRVGILYNESDFMNTCDRIHSQIQKYTKKRN